MASRRTAKAQELSIEADISEPITLLKDLGANGNKVMKRMLSGIGTAAKAPVKKAYKSFGLSKQTGALYKSIRRKVMRNGKAVIIDAKALSKGNIFYGYALAKGSLIKPKNGEYLTFQKDGKWMRVCSVKLPERDFVAQPVGKYLQSPAFKLKVDQLMDKEIKRLEKENSK
jgi:hypothetical protein